MPASVIEYEVVQAGPEVAELKDALNTMGRKGFMLKHTRTDDTGVYTFIFMKDTGITADEESPSGGDWIDDGFVNEETSWT